MPVITATAANEGTVQVSLPLSIPGAATIVCTSKNGQNSVTYTINLTISTTPSTDATLKSLSVNGNAIEGFKADSFAYAVTIAYTDALPIVTAETNDAFATAEVTNVTEVTKAGNNATVVVTAQDGETQMTYTVTFKRADAIKKINEVVLSNYYSAYINEGETVIRGWYLAGEDMPTISSYKVNDGTTWSQNGNVITLTGVDGETAEYTLNIQPVTPVEFSATEIVFDGTETWVKSAYGWANDKKWKFSKTDSDYSREIAGKTHVELFLPACDTLYLTPFSGTERDVRFYINGVEFGSKTKFVKAGLILNVQQAAPFMLTIASAQSSGDGGIAAIRMARKDNSGQAIETTKSDVHCVKVLRDGQLLIIRNEDIYTIQGQHVQ
jgi:hypothetical protein